MSNKIVIEFNYKNITIELDKLHYKELGVKTKFQLNINNLCLKKNRATFKYLGLMYSRNTSV